MKKSKDSGSGGSVISEPTNSKKSAAVHYLNPNDVCLVGVDVPDSFYPPLADPERCKPGELHAYWVDQIVHFGKVPGNGTIRFIAGRLNGEDVTKACIVDSRQRTLACREANAIRAQKGLHAVKMRYIEDVASDSFDSMISLNIGRREDSPLQKAKLAQQLRESGYSDEDIRIRFMVEQQTVDNWKVLHQCSPEIQKKIESGELAASVGYSIGAESPEKQKEIVSSLQQLGTTKGKAAIANAETLKQKTTSKKPVAPLASKKPLTKHAIERICAELEALIKSKKDGNGGANAELAAAVIMILQGRDSQCDTLGEYGVIQEAFIRALTTPAAPKKRGRKPKTEATK